MTSQGRGGRGHDNSMETILTFDNRDVQSQWSVVWSTTNIPGLENMSAPTARTRKRGRRRLRVGSLALSALLTMHCRISASALTGGFFLFLIYMVASVICLASPLRHFEVYLGQWSISGPGRAFHIIPMLDGIGIAMCINAITRAITCCAVAAIAAIYVIHSVADAKLPFTYCRDFDLNAYDPIKKDIKVLSLHEPELSGIFEEEKSSTVGLKYRAWRNVSFLKNNEKSGPPRQIEVCKETYPERFPSLFSTPAYNFFYVEVVQLRLDDSLGHFNLLLAITIILAWLIIWSIMVFEKFQYGRLIWNNMPPWFIIIPWVWTMLLAGNAASNLAFVTMVRTAFQVGSKEFVASIADALQVALYIHSVTVGTELIHGKALNYYASGHIDPNLNSENVWHSVTVLALVSLNSAGAALCALVDYNIYPDSVGNFNTRESTLWILPMYSKCTSISDYSHLVSVLVFGGLALSHMTVAFVLLKTALHIIFEYRVKLVFAEQVVVGGLILTCMLCCLVFATSGGIAVLESVDALMTGVAMPLIVTLEVAALMFVYRSHDFQSDMRVATEENMCSTRMSIQWHIIPIISLITLILKLSALLETEMPTLSIYWALPPLVAILLAVPMRALHNVYRFLHPSARTH